MTRGIFCADGKLFYNVQCFLYARERTFFVDVQVFWGGELNYIVDVFCCVLLLALTFDGEGIIFMEVKRYTNLQCR